MKISNWEIVLNQRHLQEKNSYVQQKTPFLAFFKQNKTFFQLLDHQKYFITVKQQLWSNTFLQASSHSVYNATLFQHNKIKTNEHYLLIRTEE